MVLIGQMLISAPRRVSDRGSQAALLGGLTATILVVVQSNATLGDGLLAASAMALLHLLVVRNLSSNGQGRSHLVYYDDAWLTPMLDACGVPEVELQETFERLDDRSEVEAGILFPDGSIRALFRDGRSAVSRRAGNGYRDWTYPGPPS